MNDQIRRLTRLAAEMAELTTGMAHPAPYPTMGTMMIQEAYACIGMHASVEGCDGTLVIAAIAYDAGTVAVAPALGGARRSMFFDQVTPLPNMQRVCGPDGTAVGLHEHRPATLLPGVVWDDGSLLSTAIRAAFNDGGLAHDQTVLVADGDGHVCRAYLDTADGHPDHLSWSGPGAVPGVHGDAHLGPWKIVGDNHLCPEVTRDEHVSVLRRGVKAHGTLIRGRFPVESKTEEAIRVLDHQRNRDEILAESGLASAGDYIVDAETGLSGEAATMLIDTINHHLSYEGAMRMDHVSAFLGDEDADLVEAVIAAVIEEGKWTTVEVGGDKALVRAKDDAAVLHPEPGRGCDNDGHVAAYLELFRAAEVGRSQTAGEWARCVGLEPGPRGGSVSDATHAVRLAVIVGVLVMEGFDPGSVFPTYRRV